MQKQFLFLWTAAFIVCAPLGAADLTKAFQEPAESARPQTYWMWLNGNISREGITADIEAMAGNHIQSGIIFPLGMESPGPVKFFSDEWIALFRHAVSEAGRCGTHIALHNSPGWSCSGGPWIDAEHNMQILTSSRILAEGNGTEQTLVLPQPWSNLDYYREVAVVAWPSGPTMADAKPTITASIPVDGALLMDGRPDTQITLPEAVAGQERFIQAEFPGPVTAEGVWITHFGSRPGTGGELQVSDDGENFRTVARFEYSEFIHFAGGQTQVAFAPVTGKVFRLKFDPAWSGPISIGEVDLAMAPVIKDFLPKAGYHTPWGGAFYGWAASSTSGETIPSARVVDLGMFLDASGRLRWTVPPGRWTVLRIGQTAGGVQARPLPTDVTALECDKLSKPAVKIHYDSFVGRLAKLCGPLTGRAFTYADTDSWEVGSQNWTVGLPEEFRKRRGYDLTPFLPLLLTGRVEDGLEVSERFLEDYRQTLQELLLENFFGYYAGLCHADGLRFWTENYHMLFSDTLDVAGKVDGVMGEFWSNYQPDLTDLHMLGRHVSSCSQVYGQPLAPAEAFTTHLDRWTECPKTLKAKGDLMYTGGVNQFVFHRYAHQPWPDREPGMTMGPNGIHMERTNTWWDESHAWIEYLERCQSLLQQGSVVGQVVVLMPKYVPAAMTEVATRYKWIKKELPQGFDYVFCSQDGLVQKSQVENGMVRFPLGEGYRLVVLPDTNVSSPEVLTKIRTLLEAGVMVFATQRPDRAFGLHDHAARDREIQKLAAGIWGDVDGRHTTSRKVGKGLLVQGLPLAGAVRLAGIRPSFEFANADGSPIEPLNVAGNVRQVNAIHRQAEGAEFYFVANNTQQYQRLVCRFGVTGMAPERWDPETGRTWKLAAWRETDGATEVALNFDPAESAFIVFRKTSGADPIVSLKRDGGELFPSFSHCARDFSVDPHVVDNFTMAAWVKAGGPIPLPEEATSGISGVPGCCVVYPVPGHEVFGPDQAGAGFTVGANGIVVMEHGADCYADVLVYPTTPGNDWLHVAVVYRDHTPTLYVNGRAVKTGLCGPRPVHPSVGVAHARTIPAFDGRVTGLRSISKPLEEAEIQTLMEETRGKTNKEEIIRKAVYGVLEDPARTRDVTARVQSLMVGESLTMPVLNMAHPDDPAPGVVKTLRVEYTLHGEVMTASGMDGQTLKLEAPVSRPEDWCLTIDGKGAISLKTDMAGKFVATSASGKVSDIAVPALPSPLVATGPWKVEFQSGRGAPESAEFPRLISWSEHEDEGIRYFSGHATYHGRITVPQSLLTPNRRLLLDLGGVEVIASLKINGKECGILWHTPYQTDVTDVLKPGVNDLEIRVVNLWPNRIIGDLRNPDAKPFTYCNSQLYTAGDALLPSGLLGPVTLRAVSDLP